MNKRILSLVLALVMALSLSPAAAAAADLPNGYWPYWSAFDAVRNGTDDQAVLRTGQNLIQFYSRYQLNTDIAGQLYLVYLEFRDRGIYESMNDYEQASEVLEKLAELSDYLGFTDMAIACRVRKEAYEPKAGVYAVSYTQNNTYGETSVPASGTYFGCISASVSKIFTDKSIISYYIESDYGSTTQYSSEIHAMDDGQRAIMVNYNFTGEGGTARSMTTGKYDAGLRSLLGDLATLKGPILMRIAAEMDVWTYTVTPEDYIAAYRYAANMARQLAPNVALVWAPNYTSRWPSPGTPETDDFYPGDEYVDWVGVSLYYNYPPSDGNTDVDWLAYIGAMGFADPVRNAAKMAEIAEKHNKPLIATEGGAYKSSSNGQPADFVREKAAKMYSTLNMVFPQTKAILYFDRIAPENNRDYTLTGEIGEAVKNAAEANPALIQPDSYGSAATWIPLEQFSEAVSGSLLIGSSGWTYNKSDLSAQYRLDGAWASNTPGSPNHFRLNLDTLPYGKHQFEVRLTDGAGYETSKMYTLDYSSDGTLLCTEGYTPDMAKVSTQEITFNGQKVSLNTFIITNARGGDTNYVLLRDIAALVDGTGAQFDVGWDSAAGQISITGGTSYASRNGKEGQRVFSTDQSYQLLASSVKVDGEDTKLGGIVLTDSADGGYTYFKLRDLGEVCGFAVGWQQDTGIIVNTDS